MIGFSTRLTFAVAHAPPPQLPPTLQYWPEIELDVVDAAVVAVALQAVMVVHDVDVMVEEERTVTICVHDGTAKAEHEDEEDKEEEEEDPEEDDVALELWLPEV